MTMPTLRAVSGDITTLEADAIVNAANTRLAPGGGVCGAIHRAAGPGLAAECEKIGNCQTGDARITGGGDLRARFVIHAVGPVWRDGKQGEPAALAGCYRRALKLAAENNARSIAFPCIGTGIYGCPPEFAAKTAVETVRGFLSTPGAAGQLKEVIFCCFGDSDLQIYRRLLKS